MRSPDVNVGAFSTQRFVELLCRTLEVSVVSGLIARCFSFVMWLQSHGDAGIRVWLDGVSTFLALSTVLFFLVDLLLLFADGRRARFRFARAFVYLVLIILIPYPLGLKP